MLVRRCYHFPVNKNQGINLDLSACMVSLEGRKIIMRKVMMLLQRSVSLAISHSQVAFYKVDTAEGVKVNLEQLLLAILPLIIINFFPPSFSYHVWCYPFICGEDVFIVIYSSTLNISLLPFDFRQEFLEICRIYMRLWKRHKWWFKLRQCGCKKNWLRMSNVLNMLFSYSFAQLYNVIILYCRAEFDGYCEGELIKVC